jgi:Uroporphyrinogen-III synthase
MIVNTRPTEIGNKTNNLLNELKCDFIHIPFTKIEELEPPASAKILLDKLSNYDAVIFTSQSAVKYGIKFFQEKYANVNHIPIISIGLATQRCLNDLGISSVVPKTNNSEGIAKLITKKIIGNA